MVDTGCVRCSQEKIRKSLKGRCCLVKIAVRRIATQQEPAIAAAIGRLYRFTSKRDALAVLAGLGRGFVRAKGAVPPHENGSPVVKLWVKDFELSAEDRSKGYEGHFAHLWVEFLEIGYYTIRAEKVHAPLARHPRKGKIKGKHPNRDNPVMRAVERGKTFASFEEARALLEALHVDYPLATTPTADALKILLFSRDGAKDGKKVPIEKVTVKVKILSEGGAKLVLVQAPAREAAATEGVKPTDSTPVPSHGKYTALVKKQRK
jgi:hypothetical protein